MNGVELFLLARNLMKIAEASIPTEGIGPQKGTTRSVMAVLSDVLEHRVTSVGEIARRTGLPQSAVSNAVVRLTQAGSITIGADPLDARRSIIRIAARVSARGKKVAASTIDDALATALGVKRGEARSVVRSLEGLARQLKQPGAGPASRASRR